MTREQLYNLVWSKPMTHLAVDFGISDVAIRKHCKKYDIATPPVGYWAKLAHGKRVRRTPLSTKNYSADVSVDLRPKARQAESEESLQAAEAIEARLESLQTKLVIPDRLPRQPSSLIRITKDQFTSAKPDNHGFLSIGSSYYPSISIGRASVQRLLLILCALKDAAVSEGQSLYEEDGSYYWRVNDERFDLRIYETKDKKPHEPTRAELKEQARHDQWRKEHPDWYSSDRKAYRTWDYVPSGRLTLELSGSERYGWGTERTEQRWRDSKTKSLELCLTDVFIWLASAEVIVRENRLKYEEKLQIEAAAREQRRINIERCKKAKELERYILELAELRKTSDNISKLLSFLSDIEKPDGWATSRLIEELHCYQKYLQSKTEDPAIATFLDNIENNRNTPLLIPFLVTDQTINGIT